MSLTKKEQKVIRYTGYVAAGVTGFAVAKAVAPVTIAGKLGTIALGVVAGGVAQTTTTIVGTHAVTKAKEIELFNSL